MPLEQPDCVRTAQAAGHGCKIDGRNGEGGNCTGEKGGRPRFRVADVERAVETAAAYAKEQDVPLTVERLAAELHMDAVEFCRLAKGEGREAWRLVLRDAYEQANASVVEYAMKRGSSANMHMLYLKQYAGYRDGEETAGEPVVFAGEGEL